MKMYQKQKLKLLGYRGRKGGRGREREREFLKASEIGE